METPSCPFCPFSDADTQFVAEHIEFCHPENGIPDTDPGGASTGQPEETSDDQDLHLSDRAEDDLEKYVECPHGCGEIVTRAELSSHLDLHIAEEVVNEETGSSRPGRCGEELDIHEFDGPSDNYNVEDKFELSNKGRSGHKRRSSQERTRKKGRARSPSSKASDQSRNVKKLGKSELGPHANEKRMPSWLLKMLEKPKAAQSNKIASDGKLIRQSSIENETAGVIPVLSRLCKKDKSVQRAFFCSPKARHIFKMPREGGFCGYRNIQMLISYIEESHRSEENGHFHEGVPTILQLQDLIENAWDMGFNSVGRVETGGIRGTRKYIGTPEAQALFSSLGIECEANSITATKDLRAHDALYMNIAEYFRPACSLEGADKIINTDLPPIYFQHQGHSMTIIGFEIRDNGSANLLVFDPMFKTSPAIKRLIGTSIDSTEPARLLKAHRRGSSYLQKYKVFELLKLVLKHLKKRGASARHSYHIERQIMRNSPNIIVTGTPGVGKTVHCEQLAQDIGLRHLSVNQVAKDRGCFDNYDQELETWVVDEDKLLDAIEDEVLQGGCLIDWHACDLFPKSWIDLVVVLRCPSTSVHYDRLSTRGYPESKLQENLDAEIFGVLLEEARESFDEEAVVELNSEKDDDVESNCARISAWVESWKRTQAEDRD